MIYIIQKSQLFHDVNTLHWLLKYCMRLLVTVSGYFEAKVEENVLQTSGSHETVRFYFTGVVNQSHVLTNLFYIKNLRVPANNCAR